MKFKIGQAVTVISYPNETMAPEMTKFCGRKVTISKVKPWSGKDNTVYRITEDKEKFGWMNHDFEKEDIE